MAEYIEREAALESVREKLLITDALPDGIPRYASTFTLASMQHSLEAIPAADVRPVVLCRDCSYTDYSGMGNGTVWCMEMERAMQETDFCSRGKREES